MSRRIPILLYHGIIPSGTGASSGLDVSIDQFETDMRRLHAQGWRCLPASQAAELNLAGKHSARAFALTFDDGYLDFMEFAHPVLRDLGFGATVFVVTDSIGRSADWGSTYGGSLLDAEQIRSLASEGVSFGSHSRTHPDLRTCSDPALTDELVGSREALSELVGREVTEIAWPYGGNDGRTRQAAERAGYRLGYAVAGNGRLSRRVRSALSPASRDRLAVPRREVRGTDSVKRRRLRLGPGDALFVAARKLRSGGKQA
jgi:peptidoglycan/xylan/chitin deacetylase (PgdA/CDA1 family)